MSAPKTVTVELDPDEYESLEQEAKRLGMRPARLVQAWVRAGLENNASDKEQRRRQLLEVLERARAFQEKLRREGYPSVDAVQLVREGREELERRTAEQWP